MFILLATISTKRNSWGEECSSITARYKICITVKGLNPGESILVTDLQSFTLMMASAQVVETSINTNNSPCQDYTTNPDNHSNHTDRYKIVQFSVSCRILVAKENIFLKKTFNPIVWFKLDPM